MNLTSLFDNLTTRFAILKAKIDAENHVNRLDINHILETTSLRILNEVYGYNLKNANILSKNFQGVDGVDSDQGVMVQITKTFSVEKITHTLEQVNKMELKNSFDKLFFFFLGDKRTLQPSSIEKIRRLTPKGIRFDPKRDLLDSRDIVNEIFRYQSVKSGLAVLDILEEVLGILPENKTQGFQSIGLTFENHLDQASKVAEQVLSQGFNLYTSSLELYNSFKEHGNFDRLVLADSGTNIDHLRYLLVMVSEECIETNLATETPKCRLLKHILNHDDESRIQLVSMNPGMSRSRIQNKGLRTWKNIGNPESDIKEALDKLFDDEVELSLEVEETIRELKRVYTNFIFTVLHEEQEPGYNLVQLNMEEHKSMVLYFIILDKKYVLHSVKDHFNRHFSNLDKKLITVLAPKDPYHKTDQRLVRIKNELKLEKVSYVSDHLFERTLKKEKQIPLLEDVGFVDPIIEGSTFEDGIESIKNWVEDKSASSISIIKGPGGIGKTTFCKKFFDSP
jgi:hypothetical protein